MKNRTEILDLFNRQHGVAHCHQLREHGMSWQTIGRQRRRGEFVDVLPGVVRVASAPANFEARAMSVQLHSAPDGFLSGYTAAHLYGMRAMPTQRIDATMFRHDQTILPRWVDRSYSNWHDTDDIIDRHGFRVERPLSMLFTLAACCTDHRFERAAEDAWHLGLITPESARDYVETYRRSGRSGVARLNRWLDKTSARQRPMQSNFEVDIVDAIRGVGLPEPAKQYPLTLTNGETIHIDVAWPDIRLGIEPGHSGYHGGDSMTRKDRARDRACGVLGWYIARYDEAARRKLHAVGLEIAKLYRARHAG